MARGNTVASLMPGLRQAVAAIDALVAFTSTATPRIAAAGFIPAWRAARVDPMVVLRQE